MKWSMFKYHISSFHNRNICIRLFLCMCLKCNTQYLVTSRMLWCLKWYSIVQHWIADIDQRILRTSAQGQDLASAWSWLCKNLPYPYHSGLFHWHSVSERILANAFASFHYVIICSCIDLLHDKHQPVIRVSAALLIETLEMTCIAIQISFTKKNNSKYRLPNDGDFVHTSNVLMH